MNDQTNAVSQKTKRSVAERILDLKAQIAKLEASQAADAIINNVSIGDKVQFKYGRADKSRLLDGVVTAVKDLDTGKLLRVAINVGTFDEDALKVYARDVTVNHTKDAAADTPDQTADSLLAA